MKENRTASIPGWLMEFAANVVRQLPRDMDETTAQGWNSNQKALKEALAKALIPDTVVNDPRFQLLNEFELTVPSDYIHNKQLSLFSKNHRKEFYYYNDDITDEHFAGVTNPLVPGEKCAVKIFQITEHVSSEAILAFQKTLPGIKFVGGQGLSLVYHLKKEEFPKGKYTISLDEKDSLWEDAGGCLGVPRVSRRSDGGWDFYLGYFGGDWRDYYCLLCFCDLK